MSRFKAMLKAKEAEHRQGHLLSQENASFTESLSGFSPIFNWPECTIQLSLDQAFSASAL